MREHGPGDCRRQGGNPPTPATSPPATAPVGPPPLDRVAAVPLALELEPPKASLLGRLFRQKWLLWGVAPLAALAAVLVLLWLVLSTRAGAGCDRSRTPARDCGRGGDCRSAPPTPRDRSPGALSDANAARRNAPSSPDGGRRRRSPTSAQPDSSASDAAVSTGRREAAAARSVFLGWRRGGRRRGEGRTSGRGQEGPAAAGGRCRPAGRSLAETRIDRRAAGQGGGSVGGDGHVARHAGCRRHDAAWRRAARSDLAAASFHHRRQGAAGGRRHRKGWPWRSKTARSSSPRRPNTAKRCERCAIPWPT